MTLPSFLSIEWPQRDPRTLHWYGSGNWPLLATILSSYILSVKVILPRYMRDRKPFNLTNVLRVYNITLVLINIFFFYNVAPRTYLGGHYNWFCQGLNFEPDANDQRTWDVLSFAYFYSQVRIFEFLDTIFFVLRKKFNQASTLNISHHCISVMLPWWGCSYGFDGQVMLLVIINMFVHILMYFYYFLSSFGPAVQKYLFWKKYLTRLQILQFIVTALHMSVPLFYDCGYPKLTAIFTLASMIYFMVMFGNFYKSSYKSGRSMGEGNSHAAVTTTSTTMMNNHHHPHHHHHHETNNSNNRSKAD